jgi:hypothetical protein
MEIVRSKGPVRSGGDEGPVGGLEWMEKKRLRCVAVSVGKLHYGVVGDVCDVGKGVKGGMVMTALSSQGGGARRRGFS